nr:hypothetical protein [Candidatus Sigynarchaeum springense]MDO8116428.1 hypothetical protein [Candidatus Sigynarchaeota archaeon]
MNIAESSTDNKQKERLFQEYVQLLQSMKKTRAKIEEIKKKRGIH